MDAQELRNIQEAYIEVVKNQELDEELTGARKKRSLEKGGYLANRVASGKEGQPVERRNRSGDITMRTTTKAPTKRGGEEDKGERKTDWYGYEADRGSGNKAKRRAAELNKEELDLYDIILSHLLDEGYAETPEAANAIMVNMSEEWRDVILDEGLLDYQSFKDKRKRVKAKVKELESQKSKYPKDLGFRNTRLQKRIDSMSKVLSKKNKEIKNSSQEKSYNAMAKGGFKHHDNPDSKYYIP